MARLTFSDSCFCADPGRRIPAEAIDFSRQGQMALRELATVAFCGDGRSQP